MQSLLFLLISGENGVDKLFDVGQSSFLWTLIIFGVSLPLLWKFIFGPIARSMEEREMKARAAAAAAEAARGETEEMRLAMEADLATARQDAARQVSEAKARAEDRERELMAAAKAEAEKERSRAREEIDAAIASARELLRREAVELGMSVAEKALGRSFSSEDQQRLVADFQKEFSSGS